MAPGVFTSHAADPLTSAPANMQPITSALTSSVLVGGTSTTPLDLKGSDGRLEVQIQPGSLDLTTATLTQGGGAPVGAVSACTWSN